MMANNRLYLRDTESATIFLPEAANGTELWLLNASSQYNYSSPVTIEGFGALNPGQWMLLVAVSPLGWVRFGAGSV